MILRRLISAAIFTAIFALPSAAMASDPCLWTSVPTNTPAEVALHAMRDC